MRSTPTFVTSLRPIAIALSSEPISIAKLGTTEREGLSEPYSG